MTTAAVKRSYGAIGIVDLVQKGHDFFAQAKRSGVAGRRSAVALKHDAEEAEESSQSQPHVCQLQRGPAACTGDQRVGCRENDWLHF